jgi:hypothetical protein
MGLLPVKFAVDPYNEYNYAWRTAGQDYLTPAIMYELDKSRKRKKSAQNKKNSTSLFPPWMS